ncbi:MAG: 2-succinyl-6-hydroxy-2,4-cyclohexadiene-1-carboxylate synthase [Myxococcaceae bacterium]
MRLAFETWGLGSQPLVLLHGFSGNKTSWRHFTPYWKDLYSVIAVDLPGHGESDAPPPGRAGFQATLDALDALVRERAREPVHVVGYSLGARMALHWALRGGGRVVSRLVLESGTPGLRRRKAQRARVRDDERWVSLLETKGVSAFVEAWERQPLFQTLERIPGELRTALRERRLSARREGLVASLRALGTGAQRSAWNDLHRLRVPTLLVTGAQDAKFTEIAKRMSAELPLAWRCTIAGAGHAPHLEAPEAYAAEVSSFLNHLLPGDEDWTSRAEGRSRS